MNTENPLPETGTEPKRPPLLRLEFCHTHTLNGAQWAAAFEQALETSKPVICYDFATKRNFQDTLLLVWDRPGLVKVVPRAKLAEYQKAGLVRPQ